MLTAPQGPKYALPAVVAVSPPPALAIPRSCTVTVGLEINSSSVVTVNVTVFLVRPDAPSAPVPVPEPPDNIAVIVGSMVSVAFPNEPVAVAFPALSETEPANATFGVSLAAIDESKVRNTL